MPERALPWWFFPISRSVAAASIRGLVRAAGSVVGLPPTVVGTTHRVLRFIDPRSGGAFVFLSEQWVAAAREIRAEYQARQTIAPAAMIVNYIVTDVPSRDGPILAHTNTMDGNVEFELEHVEGADLVVTLTYASAKSLLVDADATSAMQDFTSGRIKVDGDVTKVLMMAAAPLDPLTLEIAERIRAITAS